MKTSTLICLIGFLPLNAISADFYPPKTELNSGQISFSCAVSLGITTVFLSDRKAQADYDLAVRWTDAKKYAIDCRDSKGLTRTTVRRIGGYAHDDGVSFTIDPAKLRITKIRYGRGDERAVSVTTNWSFESPTK